MSEPRWLTVARKDIGVKEIVGRKNNPRVIEMYREAGAPQSSDEVAWCSAAVGSWLHRCGIKGSGSLAAVSYKRYGQPLAGPVQGAIMWMPRVGGTGHTGIVESTAPGRVNLLAGNQSNMVCIRSIPITREMTFRWPPGHPLPIAARAPHGEHPKVRFTKTKVRPHG